MNRIKTAIILSVMFIFILGCTAKNTTEQNVKMIPAKTNVSGPVTQTEDSQMKLPNTYSNGLFSIQYPDGWNYTVDEYETSAEFAVLPKESTSLIGMTVSTYSSKTTAELEQPKLKSIENSQGTVTLGSKENVLFAGQPALKLTLSVNSMAFKGEQVEYLLEKNGKALDITFLKPLDATEKEKKELAQIQESFRFE